MIRPFPVSDVALVSSTVSAVDPLCTTASSTISTSSVANPSVITVSAPHSITVGQNFVVTIAGHSGSTPSINGEYLATATGASAFTIPVNVTVGGTGGTAVTPCYKSGVTYAQGTTIQVDSPTFTFIASGVNLTATAHGWVVGDKLKVSTTGTLPTGLASGMLYHIVIATTDTIKISATKNGAPIITSGGSGTHTATMSKHNLYESQTGTNIGNTPHKSTTQWLDLGATNRWKCFDGSITSQTENANLIQYVVQCKGRIDSLALMNASGAEVVISARTATMAVGSTTNATGYAIGLSTVTIASAGTGAITVGDIVTFSGQTTQYTVTSGDADVSNGGTISFTPALVASIPASATAITVTAYGPSTYSLISSISVTSFWAWFYETIERKYNFVDIDFPPYNNLEVTATLNDTGNTAKCGGMIIGLSKQIGKSQYGASTSITDYSVKSTDDFGNKVVTERAYADRANFSVVLDRLAVDGIKQLLTQFRAIPAVYVGSESYSSTIYYGFYRDFSVIIEGPSHSICNIELEGLT